MELVELQTDNTLKSSFEDKPLSFMPLFMQSGVQLEALHCNVLPFEGIILFIVIVSQQDIKNFLLGSYTVNNKLQKSKWKYQLTEIMT